MANTDFDPAAACAAPVGPTDAYGAAKFAKRLGGGEFDSDGVGCAVRYDQVGADHGFSFLGSWFKGVGAGFV